MSGNRGLSDGDASPIIGCFFSILLFAIYCYAL